MQRCGRQLFLKKFWRYRLYISTSSVVIKIYCTSQNLSVSEGSQVSLFALAICNLSQKVVSVKAEIMVSSVIPQCRENHTSLQYSKHLRVENACHLVWQISTPLKITQSWSLLLPCAYGCKIHLICYFIEDCQQQGFSGLLCRSLSEEIILKINLLE